MPDKHQDAEPEVVFETALVQLWHKTVTKFNTPKAVIYLACESPDAYQSPEKAVQSRVWAKLVEDVLNEISYDAHLAGLDFSLSPTTYGFLISFSGWAELLFTTLAYML